MRHAWLIALVVACGPRPSATPPPAPVLIPLEVDTWRDRIIPLNASSMPGTSVRLYGTRTCVGPELARARADTAGSASLPVEAVDGTTNVFSATATDAEGRVSECSGVVTVDVRLPRDARPPAPTITSLTPAKLDSYSTWTLRGHAAAGSRVRLFSLTTCLGGVLAETSAERFADDGLTTFGGRQLGLGGFSLGIDAVIDPALSSDCLAVSVAGSVGFPVAPPTDIEVLTPSPSSDEFAFVKATLWSRTLLEVFADQAACLDPRATSTRNLGAGPCDPNPRGACTVLVAVRVFSNVPENVLWARTNSKAGHFSECVQIATRVVVDPSLPPYPLTARLERRESSLFLVARAPVRHSVQVFASPACEDTPTYQLPALEGAAGIGLFDSGGAWSVRGLDPADGGIGPCVGPLDPP